jgi:CRISPR-associated endonuclease/helicase Cas3
MAKNLDLYAHSLPGRPMAEWQPLQAHLEAVAELARGHAEAFGAGEWGYLAGLWHDLGKALPAFQRRIREPESRQRVEHSLAGALAAQRRSDAGPQWLSLALVIAGHHAGLANLKNATQETDGADAGGGPKPLLERLAKGKWSEIEACLDGPLTTLVDTTLPAPPRWLADPGADRYTSRRRFELWTRFLFSALIDADRLDTERFYQGDGRLQATAGFGPPAVLRQRLDTHLSQLVAGLAPAQRDSPVNRARAEVLAACRAAAELAPGIFSLTVPTGGGKTLSAMAFALAHAESHGLRRVIAAIPYTSIIEQNAAVYRRALGDGQVIEHHSSLDPEKETERNKLASENWDAPVIVTTNVQLFESLLSNRTSRCRKLHNVARSVLLLDEVQTLPPELLAPVLDLLRELVATFGCTIVLSTATQPALGAREGFEEGLPDVREIMPDPASMAQRLRRFEVRWPGGLGADGEGGTGDGAPTTWQELAQRVGAEPRALAIVHRRQDARELAQRLPAAGRFHLSALMCADHRSQVLAEVKARLLEPGAPCRVVSTQLIEAGVDVDFPVVFRALAGLDSLVQAGGRCNREGKLEGPGRLDIFRAPTSPPPGILRQGLESMEALLKSRGAELDLLAPDVIERYFRMLFMKIDRDRSRVQDARERLAFHDTACRFRMIDDAWSAPLVVPWGEADDRLEALRELGPDRLRLRALQRYSVNLARRSLEALRDQGAIETIHETVDTLTVPFRYLYDPIWGLALPAAGETVTPEPLIV